MYKLSKMVVCKQNHAEVYLLGGESISNCFEYENMLQVLTFDCPGFRALERGKISGESVDACAGNTCVSSQKGGNAICAEHVQPSFQVLRIGFRFGFVPEAFRLVV